jgi:hypothetical protein
MISIPRRFLGLGWSPSGYATISLINYALFGNSESKLWVSKKLPLLEHPSLFQILDKYGVATI